MELLRIQRNDFSRWFRCVFRCVKPFVKLFLDLLKPFLMLKGHVRGFNAALAACEEQGAWLVALAILRLLLEPDVIAFGSAVSACAVAKQWLSALRLLESMEAQRLKPNVPCFTGALLSLQALGAVRAYGEGQRLVERIAQLEMDVVCKATLAAAAERAQEFGQQLRLLRDCEEWPGALGRAREGGEGLVFDGFSHVLRGFGRLFGRLGAPEDLAAVS